MRLRDHLSDLLGLGFDRGERRRYRRLRGSKPVSIRQVQSLFRLFEPHHAGHRLIRVGADYDGGYLLPDDLEGIVACFSPGVDVTVSFDADIAQRGIPGFLADASIEGVDCGDPLLTFDRLFVGPESGGNVISMRDWIARYAPGSGDLLLQMDIESAEYDTIRAMPDADLERFRIIAIELHDLEDAFTVAGNARLTEFMKRLTDRFVICHLHPNNYFAPAEIGGIAFPRLLELTLLRRDRIRGEIGPVEMLPHPLDAPNVPGRPDWACPPFWET